jgi:hypothetical protein
LPNTVPLANVGGRDLVLEADGSRVRGIRRDGVGPQDDRFGPFTELARGTDLLASGQVWTTVDVDYSYKVEAGGLQPKQTYFYR